MMEKTINELADAAFQNALSKGFHPRGEPLIQFMGHSVANMHGEVSELWEAWRAGEQNLFCDKAEKMRALGLKPLTKQEEELADIVIRALDTSRRLGIDIQEAIASKMAYNQTRPYKHGKLN